MHLRFIQYLFMFINIFAFLLSIFTLYLHINIHIYIHINFSVHLYLSTFLSLSIYLFICLSVSHSLCRSLSLPLSVLLSVSLVPGWLRDRQMWGGYWGRECRLPNYCTVQTLIFYLSLEACTHRGFRFIQFINHNELKLDDGFIIHIETILRQRKEEKVMYKEGDQDSPR